MEDVQQFVQNMIENRPRNLAQLAHQVSYVELFPHFIIVHYLLVMLALRARPGAIEASRKHPISSLCVGVTSCFGGAIIQNALIGKSILAPFTNTQNVLLASLIWYLILFSPFDFVAKLVQVRGVKAVLLGMKEVHRIRGIKAGLAIGASAYSGNWLICIILGCVRGSGAKFLMRPIDQFMRGEVMHGYEMVQPAFSTKTAILSSVLLLSRNAGYIDMKEPILVLLIVIFAAGFNIGSLFTHIRDPYALPEEVFHFLMKAPEQLIKKDDKAKTE